MSLSSPIFPEQKTMPLALIAWEKTGIGAGALGVRISVMAFIVEDFKEILGSWQREDVSPIKLRVVLVLKSLGQLLT